MPALLLTYPSQFWTHQSLSIITIFTSLKIQPLCLERFTWLFGLWFLEDVPINYSLAKLSALFTILPKFHCLWISLHVSWAIAAWQDLEAWELFRYIFLLYYACLGIWCLSLRWWYQILSCVVQTTFRKEWWVSAILESNSNRFIDYGCTYLLVSCKTQLKKDVPWLISYCQLLSSCMRQRLSNLIIFVPSLQPFRDFLISSSQVKQEMV